MTNNQFNIPMDIYESPKEIIVVVPIAWVNRDTIRLTIEHSKLIVTWQRISPLMKESLWLVLSECYWWEFTHLIELPMTIYYDQIFSQLTQDNVLIITVPKLYIPEHLTIEINKW